MANTKNIYDHIQPLIFKKGNYRPFLPAAEGYSLNTLSPEDIAAITGKAAPTLMYRGGDASGATELVAGTDNLTDTGTPTKEVSDSRLGGLTTVFGHNTTEGMDAASSTVGDIGVETITGLVIVAFDTIPTSGTYTIFGKRTSAAGNQGWELTIDATGPRWVIDEAAGVTSRQVAVDHGTVNPQVILFKRSITDNESGLWTREGSSTGTDGSGQTLTNSDVMTFGDSALRNAAGFALGAGMLWIGSDGDGFGESDRLAVAQALGYE